MAEFPSVPPSSLSFPKNEGDILEYWESPEHFTKSAFFDSLERNKELPLYSFYDGPPFASGNPHHGHILAGTIKDVVTRYAHQTGHNVPRRFGWDCHGVPVENEINKMHNISRREDVLGREDRGVKWYNDECRKIVMRCVDRWQSTTRRLGRWIDFESDYKTMNVEFMESVWSVFRRLYDLNLVYRGERVMPVSTSLGTPVSKHETGPETYQDTSDLSVFVSFTVADDASGEELVAWTTTPWTLVSNIGLCVNANMTYIKIKVKKTGRTFILAKDQVGQLFPESEYDLVGEPFLGAKLKGTRYKPMYPLFESPEYFQVICDDYVTAGSGSGIVHLAPGFGEDDHRVCLANGLIKEGSGLPCPVDDEGHFTNELLFVNPTHELAQKLVGKHVKTKEEGNANALIVANLKADGKLLKSGSIVHKVPFCSRSKTPLIFKAVKSWFIRVDTGEIEVDGEKRSLRDVMVEKNAEIRWVPDFVGKGRFHEWLKQARDWNVSRNRFWGTPIPIWESEDGSERVCVGSLQELADLSGNPELLTDIHREFVDKIEFRLRPDGPLLRRVPELFDCWFESGSMPYATTSYMFDPKDFNKAPPSTFPADFIAEGLDQTRGWFYTLVVLSTALFKVPPFKNVIVNGLVLAEDGKKMSKSLKNYPPPEDVMERHGADALRLYLINSPVVKAEPLRFSEEGVSGVVRDVFLPWLNALRFFLQNVKRTMTTDMPWDTNLAKQRSEASTNTMDLWILAEMRDLVVSFRREMEAYRLYNVLPRLLLFIESLTNWYVRLNRNRLKGGSGGAGAEQEEDVDADADAQQQDQGDTLAALSTLFEVLLQLSRLMAPVAPFFAEYSYQQLVPKGSPRREAESVHFLPIPERVAGGELSATDVALLRKFRALQTAVQLGRTARQQVKTKTPVVDLVLVADDAVLRSDLREMEPYLKLELNALKVTVPEDASVWGQVQLVFNEATLGKKYKKERQAVIQAVKQLSDVNALLAQLERNEEVEIIPGQPKLARGDVTVSRLFAPVGMKKEDFGVESNNELMVAANLVSNAEVEALALCREFKSQVQKLRKKLALNPEDAVSVFVQVRGANAAAVEEVLKKSDLAPQFGQSPKYAVRIGTSEQVQFQPAHEWDICLCRPYVHILNPDLPDSVVQLLSGVGSARLKQYVDGFKCSIDGTKFALQRGVDYKV